MINRYVAGSLAVVGLVQPVSAMDVRSRIDLDPLIVKHAAANNVPPALVHRIIIRESRYNPRAVGQGGALGLMQIKHATARALGYSGPADGLLDADTNLTYGVRYLAGAYRVARGDQNQAVGYYARGYYYDAKRKGMLGALARTPAAQAPVAVAAAPQPQQPQSIFQLLFSPRPQQAMQAPVQAATEEVEVPVAAQRSGRARRRQAAASSLAQPVSVQSAPQGTQQEAQSVSGSKSPLSITERSRSASRNPSLGGNSRPGAPAETGSAQTAPVVREGEVPLTRSGRSAKPSAAAGADRSARKVSAQPDDPGRHP
jgi:hypothetical protein